MSPPAIPARTRYLLNQARIEPDSMTALELAARGAQVLALLRQWWTTLEPEATAGITVAALDDALVAYAQEASKRSARTFSHRWARAWFNWKPGVLQSSAEQTIAERFLGTMARLGVLVPSGTARLRFAHDALLELYLALGYFRRKALPPLGPSPTSLVPLTTITGRATLALLAITPSSEQQVLFREVATRNLFVAAWFLYYHPEIRTEQGVWLAERLLAAIQWGQSESDRGPIVRSLDSLGESTLIACRTLLRDRGAALPAFLVAVAFIERHGATDDLVVLHELANEPHPGQWEIDRLRQKLREAEAAIIDPRAQQRYKKEETAEMIKDTAALIVGIVGTVAAKTTQPLPLGDNTIVSIAGSVAEWGGTDLLNTTTTFLQAQRILRDLVAALPATIERRKVEIADAAPHLHAACDHAIRTLSPTGTHSGDGISNTVSV
jgi:hypothetical protein